MSPNEWGQASEGPGVVEGGGFRVVRLKRAVLGFEPSDLLLVDPDLTPEGGELVIDLRGRIGRHGGGPVRGVIVGAVRKRSLTRRVRVQRIPPAMFRAGSVPWTVRTRCGV